MRQLRMISPLSYRGGFHTKALLYETLVKRDDEARLAPGLAESWQYEDHGRSLRLRLRAHAKWHDARPVHAKDVVVHFRRWLQLPEHAWLRACSEIAAVEAPSPHEVLLRLRRPAAVLPELTAINPCAIRGPGSLDREGEFVHPVGSGPWRLLSMEEDHYRYQRVADGQRIDLVPFPRQDSQELLRALGRGEIDAFISSWDDPAPGPAARAAAEDPKLQLISTAGTSLQYVSFLLHDGPSSDPKVRAAIRDAVDRAAMIEALEDGLAEPCTAWAAPSLPCSPKAAGQSPAPRPVPAALAGCQLRILCGHSQNRAYQIAQLLAAQLGDAGFEVELKALEGNAYRRALQRQEWDLRIERSWGLPYDPFITSVSRFQAPTAEASAASKRHHSLDPELEKLTRELLQAVSESEQEALYTKIQARIDQAALLLPLYAPRRFAICRSGISGIRLPLDPYQLDLDKLARR
ncbi:MAG: hypothetical protein CSA62_14170 [Planctomycetota bacterium]|nr:MAG: hypothetical protein CSA62_14170 [Planctomycetota bacterium]